MPAAGVLLLSLSKCTMKPSPEDKADTRTTYLVAADQSRLVLVSIGAQWHEGVKAGCVLESNRLLS